MITKLFNGIIEDHRLKIVIIIFLVLIGGFLTSRILQNLIGRYLNKNKSSHSFDLTSANFLKNATNFIIFLITLIFIFQFIPSLKKLGDTLLASAGIIAAGVAFASQQAFSNIISGIFVVVFKPFRVGDFIKITDVHVGTVEDITLRHTIIRNVENKRIIIPNSVVSSEIIINSNIGDPKVCSLIEIGISYDSNIDKAFAIMQDEAMKHPNFIDNRSDEDRKNGSPSVVVRVMSLGDFSVNLRAYVWANSNAEAFVLKTDLYKLIKERFDREGVEIPFPYRTVVMKENK